MFPALASASTVIILVAAPLYSLPRGQIKVFVLGAGSPVAGYPRSRIHEPKSEGP